MIIHLKTPLIVLKINLFLLLIIFSFNSYAEDQNCLYGCPTTSATNDLVKRNIYTLSSNGETKFADWVAYIVKKENFNCKAKTKRNWKPDLKIKYDKTLEPADYEDANGKLKTDRGHQAP